MLIVFFLSWYPLSDAGQMSWLDITMFLVILANLVSGVQDHLSRNLVATQLRQRSASWTCYCFIPNRRTRLSGPQQWVFMSLISLWFGWGSAHLGGAQLDGLLEESHILFQGPAGKTGMFFSWGWNDAREWGRNTAFSGQDSRLLHSKLILSYWSVPIMQSNTEVQNFAPPFNGRNHKLTWQRAEH